MHLLNLPAGRGRTTFRRIAFLALSATSLLLSGLLGNNAAVGQFAPQPPRRFINGRPASPRSTDQDMVSGVYLPTDRTLSRAVGRVRERLADHEYHEALSFLHGLLERDEDTFLERSGDDREQLGLKATARQLISQLPPEGQDVYEVLNGPAARRELEAALKSGDREALARVVRQYFNTNAGYEAALVLAQMEADLGHHFAAAQLFQELIDTPRAAARFEPQLSVAAALNQLAAGRTEEAAATIRALIERKPSAEVRISGKSVTLPGASADPVAWLSGLVGTAKVSTAADSNWLTLHGDAARNAQSPGGEPHLRARWEARVVNDPATESYLTGRSNDFLQRGAVAIPGARPIAVGDVVIMRTPDNVVAIDWETGKRVWETRDEHELDSDDVPTDLTPGIEQDTSNVQGKSLEERMWDDALATAISSDGARVFLVRGNPAPREEDNVSWQIQPGLGRAGVEASTVTNQLAAYDLATQGKLIWELDGGRTGEPLTGAFFLGPPLAIDNTLYVMAEIRSAVYLLALDPATGTLEWQQQLVGLEQGITLDPARRRVRRFALVLGRDLDLPNRRKRGNRDRCPQARVCLGLSLPARNPLDRRPQPMATTTRSVPARARQ